jgi:protein gp37
MQNSNIEWTQQTWNPITGCTKISPGCTNCYAANIAETRFGGEAAFPNGFDLVMHPERLAQVSPAHKPKLIFVNSMSDIFHKDIPEDYIRQICDVMMNARQHSYQILTKRHKRMHALLSSPRFRDVAEAKHIWWGVSAENRKYGLPRVKALQSTPIRNRFVSFEPLLEEIGEVSLDGIGWIIIGGESGPGARPFALEWAESLIDQARRDNVAPFVKQIGAKPMLMERPYRKAARDPKGTQMAAWPEKIRIQEFPDGMRVVDHEDLNGTERLIQISPATATASSAGPMLVAATSNKTEQYSVAAPSDAIEQVSTWLEAIECAGDEVLSAVVGTAIISLRGVTAVLDQRANGGAA